MRYTQTQIVEAREHLASILKPGDTVYTILRHRAASGMSHVISVVIMRKDRPIHATRSAAILLGRSVKSVLGFDGIKMEADGGMDLGFDIAHSLSQTLFGNGSDLAQEWL